MKTLLPVLFLLSSAPAVAQDMCKVASERKIQTVRLPRVPNYFFRTSADGRYIYYISNDQNYMLDTTTGGEIAINGQADPVPSADGRILTYIQNHNSYYWQMGVAVLDKGVPVKDTGVVASVPGSYQSVGAARADGSRPYLFYNETKGSIDLMSLAKTAQGTYELQQGVALVGGQVLRLPIMSPDGKYFSALNTQLNKTQIYKIEGNPPQATLSKTLPFAAGKASFSPDSSQLVYHLSRGESSNYDNDETRYPAVLSSMSMVRNVFTYDLRSNVVRQVTNNVQGNSYFPTFLNDGRVAYVNSPGEGQYEIVYSTVPQGQQRSLERVARCYGVDPMSDLSRLAREWEVACNREEMLDEKGQGAMMVLNLSDANCQTLARRSGDASLMRLCRAMRASSAPAAAQPPHPRPSPVVPATQITQGRQLVSTKCLMCHGDVSALTSVIQKVAGRLDSKDPATRMPRGGAALSQAERDAVIAYLQSVRGPAPEQ